MKSIFILFFSYLIQMSVGYYNHNNFQQQLGRDNYNHNKDSSSCVNSKGQSGKCIELGQCLLFINQHSLQHQVPFHFEQNYCSFNVFQQPKVCCVVPNPRTTDSGWFGFDSFPNNAIPDLEPEIDIRQPKNNINQPKFVVPNLPTTVKPNNVRPNPKSNKKGKKLSQNLALEDLLPSKHLAETIKKHRNFGLLPTENVCGKSAYKALKEEDETKNCYVPYVVGGKDAMFGANPWMALIEFVEKDDPSFKQFGCSGTLINDKYVLTAAHCLAPNLLPPEFKISLVRLGEYDQSKDSDCGTCGCAPKVQDVEVQNFIIHPDFNKENKFEHDIALIRLKTPAKLGPYVLPICLPIRSDLSNSDNKYITIAGWGRISNIGKKTADILQTAVLPLVSHEECANFYNDKVTENFDENAFCASGEGDKDACQGDSGGPAMKSLRSSTKPDNPLEYQLGVISFGINCSLPKSPSFYTNVAAHIPWILDTIQP